MGGRLPLTMHGAWVGSWGNPAKPQIKAAGREARRDYSSAANGADRRPLSAPAPALLRAETPFAANALGAGASACAALQKSQRRA
jgi:hypothetical protein